MRSFEISTIRHFSASHQLALYDGSLEHLHGHNWQVKVTVAADKLDAIGVVMDFHELERLVDAVVGPMHNRHLNDLEAFSNVNPSAEGVAVVVVAGIKLPGTVRMISVEVWETPENSAVYRM
jgi:6-pyruvoyltetrahydropterin/6-carboxytetrahydropterin synthase